MARKKIILFFLALCFFHSNVFSQEPSWQWAKSNGTNNEEVTSGVCTDYEGNIIVLGGFAGSSISFGNTILNNKKINYWDLFLTKYDTSGNVLWAISAGGTGHDGGGAVSVDNEGNIFVVGNFSSPTIKFGNVTLINKKTGDEDAFIVKYDAYANLIWAISIDGVASEASNHLTVDSQGNVIITGYFYSPVITSNFYTPINTSGSFTTLFNTPNPTAQTHNLFIIKYDVDGNLLWAKYPEKSNSGQEAYFPVTSDAYGNIIVTGTYSSPIVVFDSDTIVKSSFYYDSDIFIVKYDASGNVLWVKSDGNGGNNGFSQIVTSVTTDSYGNIILLGSFYGQTAIFDSTILTQHDYGHDIFLAKYNTSGNLLWAKSEGGANLDYGMTVSADIERNIIVTGYFNSPTIIFDTTTYINSSLPPQYDAFILKYNELGNVLWVKTIEGIYNEFCWATMDFKGNIIVAGQYIGDTIILGSDTLVNNSLLGSNDFFIAKIDGGYKNLSINDADNLGKMQLVYPNPSEGICFLYLNLQYSKINTQILIYDLLGNVIYQKNLSRNSKSQQRGIKELIDITSQPNGIYYVRVNSGKNNYYQKIIKQ